MFPCKRLSSELLARLQIAAFVHVSGLVYVQGDGSSRASRLYELQPVQTIGILPEGWGQWDINNGIMSIVTTEGQVWVCSLDVSNEVEAHDLAKELCPNGRGVFVHCSNGVSVSTINLLKRLADPYVDCVLT